MGWEKILVYVPSRMRPGPCFLFVDTRREGRSTTDLNPGSSAGFA